MLVVTDLDLGGAEAQVVALTCGLRRRGHELVVISMIDPVARTDELAACGVPWVSLRMRRGRPAPRALLRLRREVAVFRPDGIHSHMVPANLLTRLTPLLVPAAALTQPA